MTAFSVGIFFLYGNLLGHGQVVDFYFLMDELSSQGSAEVFALRFLCHVLFRAENVSDFEA